MAFFCPSRQSLPRYVDLALGVSLANDQHCESLFESVDDCFLAHFATVQLMSLVIFWRLAVAETVIGQVPGVVLGPTFQVHEQVPSDPAVMGPSPAALLGPLL